MTYSNHNAMANHRLPLATRLIYIFTLLIVGSCSAQTERIAAYKNMPTGFAYNTYQPDQKYVLSMNLDEVSGLSWLGNNQLACVQDEAAKVYIFDLKRKDVLRFIDFGKAGDYEGVEVVNGQAYVVKNNGDVHQFAFGQTNKAEATVHKTPLSSENDVEGLGYLPGSNQLLLALKGKGELSKKNVKGKAIYGFSLATHKLNTTPLLTIRGKDLDQYFEQNGLQHVHKGFSPSAIAWHPIEERLYVLATVGKLLVVLNQQYEIDKVVQLSPQVLRQPEGLCFAPNGDMYIASEGRSGAGYIVKYTYVPGK